MVAVTEVTQQLINSKFQMTQEQTNVKFFMIVNNSRKAHAEKQNGASDIINANYMLYIKIFHTCGFQLLKNAYLNLLIAWNHNLAVVFLKKLVTINHWPPAALENCTPIIDKILERTRQLTNP